MQLTRPCKDHPETYEMPGKCGNCGATFTLAIPRSHNAPGSGSAWDCPLCGCAKVAAAHPREAAPDIAGDFAARRRRFMRRLRP